MNKKMMAVALVAALSGMEATQAADVSDQAIATWSATAKKILPVSLLLPRWAVCRLSTQKVPKVLTLKMGFLMSVSRATCLPQALS